MKPMNDNEFRDKLSKTIANTLNALSSKETPRVKRNLISQSEIQMMVYNYE